MPSLSACSSRSCDTCAPHARPPRAWPRTTWGSSMSDETRHDVGMRVRREVLGDAHVNRATDATTEFDAPFQRFITETAWGTLWASDDLDRRTRSLITIAILAALARHEELALHLR